MPKPIKRIKLISLEKLAALMVKHPLLGLQHAILNMIITEYGNGNQAKTALQHHLTSVLVGHSENVSSNIGHIASVDMISEYYNLTQHDDYNTAETNY